MSGNGTRYRLYRTPIEIVVTAVAAALFLLRAAMSAAGVSSLHGPGWTVVSGLLAAAGLLRCFDRVVVDRGGVVGVRSGLPRHYAVARVERLIVDDHGAGWTRLDVRTIDGRTARLTARRHSAALDLRRFAEHAGATMAVPVDQVSRPSAGTTTAAAVPTGPRRCVRASCSAFRVEVRSERCDSCGGGTQRVLHPST